MDLATAVAARRKGLHLTQLDAAELSGVSERFVRAVEAGKASVQLDKLVGLLDALGLALAVELKR